MISGELIAIQTDTVPLDGIFCLPASGPVRGVAQIFHGNAMNFYVGPPRFLIPALVQHGFACLSYNRRGHDTLSTRNSRAPEGNAFQTVRQGIQDNEYARDWLAARGFPAPVLIGHSNGGMLAARHAASHPDTPALVLLSAHRGGRDLVPVACAHGLLAEDKLPEFVSRAESLVAQGRGDQLMLLPAWWNVLSAASLLDMMDNTPDLLDDAARISCPTLYLRGEAEPAALYPMEEFRARAAGHCDTRVVAGADHFYNGVEDLTAELVADWLAETVPISQGLA